MRQLRTTSVKSLSGIWPETQWNGIRVLRPLLNHKRDDLRDYLKSNDQPWIEDPSNTDERFERVRIRNADPKTNLAHIATASQAEMRAAEKSAFQWRSNNFKIDELGLAALPRESFCHLTALEKDIVIDHVSASKTELAERQRLCSWLLEAGTGRRTLGGMIFAKRKMQIILAREPARIAPEPVALAANTPTIWDNRFKIKSAITSTITAAMHIKGMKHKDKIPWFVRQGLPVVMQNSKILAALPDVNHPAIKIELIRK